MGKYFFFLSILPLFLLTGTLSSEEFIYAPPPNFSIDVKNIALHHPVSTKQISAQLYFDQGLTFYYAFNNEAAFWSFLKASEQDPQLAMAYWGLALALGGDINTQISDKQSKKALEYVQKAKELSIDSSDVEKNYIQALYKRYELNNHTQLAQQYSHAMGELVKKYPDDPDAGVLYAANLMSMNLWNQWDVNGNPNKGTLEVIAALDAVLRKTPNHIGANHYYIHVIEDSNEAERGLINAERLSRLLPASGYLVHMGSSIYLRIGNYHESTRVSELAIAADQAYIRKYGMYGSYPTHYYTHNLLFYIRSLLMEARFHEALLASQFLQTIYNPYFETMPEVEYYASTEVFTLISMRNWRALLSLAPPPEKMSLTFALWNYGRAYAYTKMGVEEKALEENRNFQKRVSAYNQPNDILKMAELFLDAAFAESKNDSSKVIQLLKEAIEIQDKLGNQGPSDWFFSARCDLGLFLLKNKSPIEAETIFRQDLKIHPRYGSALFGLRESLKLQDRNYEADWVDNELEKAWEYSDYSFHTTLPF
jgi:hypothetical protein